VKLPNSVTTIVGLEVHVQLQTASKLFCGCTTAFGGPPNTQTCVVCTGMPGSLPVLNRQALRLAIKTGLALNCAIARVTKWDRKNYFYPDLPKGYQISQFDKPICGEGRLQISDAKNSFEPKEVRIERAHLEEDAGKSIHDDRGGGESKIDLNRTGTPLLEIVTRPDMNSGQEAKAFLTELKLILGYLGVSDCNMQEGSLRVDANVNLHITDGDRIIATPIVEIKNLNSFRGVERALEFEAQRQFSEWKSSGLTIKDAPKQTRGWDDQSQQTTLQREKEESADYRYFPDPDLVEITTSESEIDEIRNEIGELPAQIRDRLALRHGIPPYDADVIVNQGRGVVDYFERVADGAGDGKLASNWVTQEVLRWLNEQQISIVEYPVAAADLVGLLAMIQAGNLDQSRAKDVLAEMTSSRSGAAAAAKKLGIESVDEGELLDICNRLIAENAHIIEQYRAGNVKAIGALIGQAKKLNPNVNPGLVRQKIIELMD
jgi:aspartyl-tRNA(Asn)/glutamyl-tRNA(Gln) amidotransferase subunit B